MHAPDTRIPGGYILYPRVFLEMLDKTPLLDRALWLWLLCRATHKDASGYTRNLKRGQVFTSVREIQNAMSHRRGYTIQKPGQQAVRRALRRLCEARMIATARVSRGMMVTIVNYGLYQNPATYERRDGERTTAGAKTQEPANYKQEGKKKEKNEKRERRKQQGAPSCSSSFKSFYQMDCEQAQESLRRAGREFLSDE